LTRAASIRQPPPEPADRNHYTEQPAAWTAACCDRGVRHQRNEDASAIAAEQQPGSRAVLVVCDGVSTSADSDIASLAAARAARDALAAQGPADATRAIDRSAALTTAMRAAVRLANESVLETTAPGSPNAASCTLAAAVLEHHLLVYAHVGDSRIYWLPDPGGEAPRLLSLDDSMAQLRIDSGTSRAEAEAGPQAHAITKWLGRDSPDTSPSIGSIELGGPGWVVVCSDGLWNYASDPNSLQRLVAESAATAAGAPLALAEALVRWACDRGGKDNVTVALARH
jgi:serine/threonine protein phosphatase PrpC